MILNTLLTSVAIQLAQAFCCHKKTLKNYLKKGNSRGNQWNSITFNPTKPHDTKQYFISRWNDNIYVHVTFWSVRRARAPLMLEGKWSASSKHSTLTSPNEIKNGKKSEEAPIEWICVIGNLLQVKVYESASLPCLRIADTLRTLQFVSYNC